MPDYLQELVMQYGYLILYVSLTLGILGLPIPDEVLLTFVGYVASIGILSFYPAALIGFLGAMSGMTLSYFIGRKVGRPLLWRHGKWLKLSPKRLKKTEEWFSRFGLWTVSFGYFIPGFRHFPCYLSGISKIPLRRYFLYAGFGALLWCLFFITIGYLIGDTLDFHRPLGEQIL